MDFFNNVLSKGGGSNQSPQHPPELLRLLPSGPDRVHNQTPLWGLTFTAINCESLNR